MKSEKNISTVCGERYGPAESLLCVDDVPELVSAIFLTDDRAISSWLNLVDCSLDSKQTK